MSRFSVRWSCRIARRPLVGFLLIFGVGCAPPTPTTGGAPPLPSASPRPATPPLKVGDTLPPLTVEGWLNGQPATPDAPGVRLLVVDVWARWCPYCEASVPGLARAHRKFSSRGCAFVSVANESRLSAEAFCARYGITWPSGYGLTSEAINALGVFSGAPGPAGYEVAPTLYIVGPDGRVRWVDKQGRHRHVEPEVWEREVEAAIEAELAGPAPRP